MASRLLLRLIWLIARLPLRVQAALGRGLGRMFWWFGRSRRRVALRNLELCLPEMAPAEREALAREHFCWLGRSLLERGLLWYAPVERLRSLIRVEGDVGLAERSERPVMWLVPHFLALDVAGVATQIFQKRKVGSIYQQQSDPVFDAAMRAGRLRFDGGEIFPRSDRALPLVRAIKRGYAFFNLPDMDFGARDAAFVPFFGVDAATLLAPSKMARSLNMVVQPVVGELLPGGDGYLVRFLEPWPDWPTDAPLADARAMNAWIETEIRRNPAQYLWVHKRFKTRPEGEASLY
ncbi:lipid A biosynthesis acyltransferase [Piscinibacter sakaiensis]|uniref:LpxL/LpxP family acyltransferase n=1 Tax=Piscinibacter sakaiensis TaxID=1547922 RepID=UPI003AACC011